MITEILENMPQKIREEILKEVTSDHLPQMFEIELRNNTKSDKSSSAEASTQVKVVTWNILARCKDPNTGGSRLKFPSNNHYRPNVAPRTASLGDDRLHNFCS